MTAGRGQKAAHHRGVEGVAPLRRSPGFLIEDRSDAGAAVTHPMQLGGACEQRGVGAERLHPRHRAYQRVGRPVSAMPVAFQPDLLTGVDHGEQNPLEQQPHDGLTLFASSLSAPATARADPSSIAGSRPVRLG